MSNNFQTYIEVEAFGDFGDRYTECIMVHTEKLDLNEILKEFYYIEGIYSNTGLGCDKLGIITKDFIYFLEMKGFKKLKTQSIYFCD